MFKYDDWNVKCSRMLSFNDGKPRALLGSKGDLVGQPTYRTLIFQKIDDEMIVMR